MAGLDAESCAADGAACLLMGVTPPLREEPESSLVSGSEVDAVPPPPDDELSPPLPPGIEVAITTTRNTDAARPSAGSVIFGQLKLRIRRLAERGKPARARSSSEWAKAGSGTGRSSRTSTARSARSARSGSTGR